MSDKLKPCPFCGSEDVRPLGFHHSTCRTCYSKGPQGDTYDESVSLWGKRHNKELEQVKAELAELKKAYLPWADFEKELLIRYELENRVDRMGKAWNYICLKHQQDVAQWRDSPSIRTLSNYGQKAEL